MGNVNILTLLSTGPKRLFAAAQKPFLFGTILPARPQSKLRHTLETDGLY